MNDEITPIDLILQIKHLYENTEELTNTTALNVDKIKDCINDLDILKTHLQILPQLNLSKQFKDASNVFFELLEKKLTSIQNKLNEDLINPHLDQLKSNYKLKLDGVEKSLINELENSLNTLKTELTSIYQATFNNALDDLKSFNSNLENSKNLSELKALSEQSLQEQKTLIKNQQNINKDFEKQLKRFKFKQSFLSIFLWLIVGIVLGILSTKILLIDYFNIYQAEKTTEIIKKQDELYKQQQEELYTLRKKQAKFDDYNIKLENIENKEYLIINAKNIKSDLIQTTNTQFKAIELSK